jgi:hypothetical protein
MTARYVVVVVLDGADGGLLVSWSGDGTLPHLQGLREWGGDPDALCSCRHQ